MAGLSSMADSRLSVELLESCQTKSRNDSGHFALRLNLPGTLLLRLCRDFGATRCLRESFLTCNKQVRSTSLWKPRCNSCVCFEQRFDVGRRLRMPWFLRSAEMKNSSKDVRSRNATRLGSHYPSNPPFADGPTGRHTLPRWKPAKFSLAVSSQGQGRL